MSRAVRQVLLLLASLLAAKAAHAGSFGVSPIRLDFDRTTRTGSISVENDDPAPLSFQMRLYEWTQDASGVDHYRESGDLIWFPQIMTLDPGQKRLIRVGLKTPAAAAEKSYRLFIEELPDPAGAEGRNTQVAVRLRFGVPLFVAPLEPRLAGSIDEATLAGGQLRLRVRNSGNRHFKFEAITVRAGGAVIGEIQGGYLLPGAARGYTVTLEPRACAAAARIEVSLAAEGLRLAHELEATPALCGP